MAQQAFLLKVIGIPFNPSITEFNIRSDAGTNQTLIFKVPVGTTNLQILEAKTDVEGRALENKVYQWFRVTFPQGQGWVRDDLVEVWGDGSPFGYPVVTQPVVAFSLSRVATPAAASPAPAAPTSFQAALSPQPSVTAPATTTVTTTTTTATSPAPAQPVQAAAPAQPAPTTVTTSPSPTVPVMTGPAMGVCMGKTGVNVRSGAGGAYTPVGRMNYKDVATVLDARAGEDNAAFFWVKVNFQGKEGWVREDYLRLSGGFKAFNLNAPDKYANPAQASWWVRGYDPTAVLYNTGPHHGWDHGGDKGSPLLAGPLGGVVFDAVFCQRCGAEGASTLERGFTLGDSRIFRDQAWNFGYGHYIIVGYDHTKLPKSTKQFLAANGKAGWHIFVMYAHLSQMLVQKGATVTPNQQIALMGNSGNSQASHLHLEIRAAQTMSIPGWAGINGGLMSPGVLFGF